MAFTNTILWLVNMTFLSPRGQNGQPRRAPYATTNGREGVADQDRLQPARIELHARLQARRAEIEREALARANAIADSTGVADPAYAQSLRTTVSAALDYALEVIEHGESDGVSLPRQLLAQARLAARNGVPLDTVLRRYVAGYTLLGDFLAREGEASGLPGATARLLPNRGDVLDRLIAAVSAEYEAELSRMAGSPSARQYANRVRRLLAGEPLDTAEIAYDFDRFHLGLVARGPGSEESVRELTGRVDCIALLVAPEDDTAWAWIGTRACIDTDALDLDLNEGREPVSIALGEPAEGFAGWRLTHRQAQAAMEVARREPSSVVRYRDVAILATALRDNVLATSFRNLYIAPLQAQRDGGEAAFATLRAYLAADRNISSAAAALGVNRNTVAERIRAIEAAIGRPLPACGPELEAALHLAEFEGFAPG